MIELVGLRRDYQVGDQLVKALDGIDLTIRDGEYISVMGPSGSGKSTLLHILGMLERQTAGIYRIDGRDVTHVSDDERARVRGERIGFVFQFFHLVPRLTAAENVELPLTLAGVRPAERRRRVEAMLDAVGLAPRARHLPNQLSGGQRQRVAIARAMITMPSVLLADEPTGNLDSTSGGEIISLLEQLNAQGITLVLVTHDPAMGRRAARTIRMIDGRIEADAAQEARAP